MATISGRSEEAQRTNSFADCLRRQGYTLEQIGKRMGVSKERARQRIICHRRLVLKDLERIQLNLRTTAYNLTRYGLLKASPDSSNGPS